jgi:hypothetical protein
MATFKATDVSNLDASPPVLGSLGKAGGIARVWQGTHEITAAYTTADILVLARVPWSLRITRMEMGWDDLNSSTFPFDVGLYYPDGVVVDADEFASALAGGTATVMTDETFEASATDLDRVGKTLWEWAGLSAEPTTQDGMVDIAITFGTNGGTTAAGTISWRITGVRDG